MNYRNPSRENGKTPLSLGIQGDLNMIILCHLEARKADILSPHPQEVQPLYQNDSWVSVSGVGILARPKITEAE